MESQELFEKRIRQINTYITLWGAQSINFNPELIADDSNKELFITKCHEGFKLGQDMIFESLIEFEREIFNIKKDAKTINNDRERKYLLDIIKIINGRSKILRKLADSIAWQLIKGEHFIARRLYMNEVYPSLLSEGTKEVKRQVDIINNDPYKFALISDITTFIQIGDIVQVDWKRKSFGIIEVKSGRINDLAFDYLTRYAGDLNEILKASGVDDKLFNQIKRIKKQLIRGELVSSLIRNEGGVDPVNNKNYSVLSSQTSLASYNDIILQLIQNSVEAKWAYTSLSYGDVTNVLHIGVYREHCRLIGNELISELLRQQSENFVVVNSLSNMSVPISIPIFLRNLPVDTKFDLLTGRIIVYLGLDFNKLIELFNFIGVSARWLTQKETHKIKELSKEFSLSGVFIHKNRAIGVKTEDSEEEFLLGDGIVARILCDYMDPFSVIQVYAEMK